MAEENVPAHAFTRSDEQILPFNAWLPVGKRNLLLDLQRLKKNPIFCILVDILWNTNFLRAFIVSANVPTIYIQHFWNTLAQDVKTGEYSFQLDEQWFTLNDDLLRKALEITLRLSLTICCLTGKTFGSDKPQHLVLQMLWGIVIRSNVDYAELPWEERPRSPVHVTGDDLLLGNLKFLPKGKKDELFGKSILKELITKAIQNSSYYQQYLEMVARKPTAKEDEEPQPAPEPQIEDDEYNLQRGIQMSLESFQAPVGGVAIREPISGVTRSLPIVKGKGKGIATDEQVAQSLLELQKPKGKVCDTPSPLDVETGVEAEMSDSNGDTKILNVGEEKGEDVSNTVVLEERRVELDEGQNPPSSSRNLSSMKNLDDAFTFGD
ncbi:hypothetical protein Tco_0186006 [Tanacetum coccineum]